MSYPGSGSNPHCNWAQTAQTTQKPILAPTSPRAASPLALVSDGAVRRGEFEHAVGVGCRKYDLAANRRLSLLRPNFCTPRRGRSARTSLRTLRRISGSRDKVIADVVA